MSAHTRCRCQSCTVRGMTGPALVITIGVLFLLDRVHGGFLYFGNTWPVLLLVIGLLQLGAALASREGHVDSNIVPPAAPPPVPPANPPSAYGSQGQ